MTVLGFAGPASPMRFVVFRPRTSPRLARSPTAAGFSPPRSPECRTSAPSALLFGLALVHLALAASEAELDLRTAALVEINRQRNHRDPLTADRPQYSVHLLFVQQQFARPAWLMIEMSRGFVFRNVGVYEVEFAAVLIGVRLGDARLALPQHLDFGAVQDNPGL